MIWHLRTSGFYEEEHILRDKDSSMIIHILKERNSDIFIGRVYSPYDNNNILRALQFEKITDISFESIKFKCLLLAKHKGHDIDFIEI